MSIADDIAKELPIMTKSELYKRYRSKLKSCGFQSWTKANRRRFELLEGGADTAEKRRELQELQELALLRIRYHTEDAKRRIVRQIEEELGIKRLRAPLQVDTYNSNTRESEGSNVAVEVRSGRQ